LSTTPTQRGTHALKRFTQRDATRASLPHRGAGLDHCELCSAALGEPHEHLLELAARRLTCACTACAVLFDVEVSAPIVQRYVRLTPQARSLTLGTIADQDLIGLGIPVRLVILCPSSVHGALYMLYPSASGPIEASAPLELWRELVERRPELRTVREDRDALIVDLRSAAPAVVHASLDVVHELLGSLRGPGGMASFEASLRALKAHGAVHG
jgi:hypothetical protein